MDARSPSAGLCRDRAVRAIVSSQRMLTRDCAGVTRDAERGTLVACSGGADSLALVLALASAGIPIVVGHVVHDLRPESEACADRDHVRGVAARLGLRFVEAAVRVRAMRGNMEGNARRARYAALRRLAADAGVAFVAAGHHADDVLESMLMRLMRGAGPRGLAGPAPSRVLRREEATDGGEVWLVRPMLGVARADAERICKSGVGGEGVPWIHDRSNDDLSLLRNAVRASVVPAMRELAPGVETRASRAAGLLREAARVLEIQVNSKLRGASRERGAIIFSRDSLLGEQRILVGDLLRAAIADLTGGAGLDRVPSSEIGRAVAAIQDRRGDMRTFGWGAGARIRVVVLRDRVVVQVGGGQNGGETDSAGGSLRP